MSRPFIGITAADAKLISEALHKSQKLMGSCDFLAVKITGAWRGRRFVVSGIERYVPRSVEVCLALESRERLFDVDRGAMVVPVVDDVSYYANELKAFGMKVAFAARRKTGKVFDNAQGSDDEIHSVLAYHHVAECGYRGPWIDSDEEPQALSCSHCTATKNQRLRIGLKPRAKMR